MRRLPAGDPPVSAEIVYCPVAPPQLSYSDADRKQARAELMAAADIYCQLNIEPDSFGITFLEALYARLTVITRALGGALEIVNDSCGMLVPRERLELAAAFETAY